MNTSSPNPGYNSQEEEIELREYLGLYLRQWPWFILGITVCLLAAFLYLRYTTPIYNTVATIIVKDEEKPGMSSELSAFADIGMFSGLKTSSIENEVGILKSRRLMRNVGNYLQLHIRYFKEGRIRTTEIYEDRPFNIQLVDYKRAESESLGFFEVVIIDSLNFKINNPELEYHSEGTFGKAITLPFGEIILTPNFDLGKENINETILVSFGILENSIENYRSSLGVHLTHENSTLIELSLKDAVIERAQDILNRLVYQYNVEAIEDKNQVSLNTAEFIEERLAIISSELDSVETNKQEFKTDNQLTDIQAEAQLFIENASEFRKEQLQVETQLELANSMIEYLKKEEDNGLLPANLGFSEPGLVAAIQSYNQTVLERDRILAGSTERNPVIINLNNQISQIKANVMQSLLNLKSSLLISKQDLSAREAAINAQISNVPPKEKAFRSILRQQNIKESLYLFLLQKREETSLALAATAPKAKIVDSAYSTNSPVSPDSKVLLMGAIILGLLIPFVIIYIKNLLNNKVQTKQDVEKQTKEIPIVGEIPRLVNKDIELIEKNDRSILAESFRILHTNLQYLLVNNSNKNGGDVIFITSTVKGEGKTFVAFNLALTLANAGKKVIIVGGDLRNPQLQRFAPGTREILGISDFLVRKDLGLEDLIKETDLHSNLFLLASGSIPPNPSELWRQEKTSQLFQELEGMYDYIIVDTAPAMLVTDTFLINKFANLTLYLVRSNYTEKKLIDFAIDSKREGKLKHIAFVINDVSAENLGYGTYKYGYGYGYAYGEDRPGFWERLRDKLTFK